MASVRIIAVSYRTLRSVETISYVWTAGGSTPVQRVVEDLWARRCGYHVLCPHGRIDVTPEPSRRPGLLARLAGKRVRGRLNCGPTGRSMNELLYLPVLPSPDRGRRSSQQHAPAVTTQT